MEVIGHPLFLGMYVLLMGLLAVVIFGGKYAFFGMKAFFKKSSGKWALVFFRLPDGNIAFPPTFHDMENTEITVKRKGIKKIYPLNRNEFTDGKIFGFAYCIKDSDDAVRSYGLYAEDFEEVQDKDGNPSFKPTTHVINAKDDSGKIQAVQTNIPKLTKEKGSYRVDPEIIDGLISKNSILSSIKDLFQKHNMMFIGIIVVGVLVLVSLYIGFENMTLMQERLLPALEAVRAEVANSAAEEATQNIPLQ